MEKNHSLILKELIELSRGDRKPYAQLAAPNSDLWPILITLDNGQRTLWNDTPWCVEDYPELKWRGRYFFHRGHRMVYLVEGTRRDFNNSIYGSRLKSFRKMVRWAVDTNVGFTIDAEVSEVWGFMLCNPWLVRSNKTLWYNRLKMYSGLNQFDPERWPMDLILSNWREFRKIRF